MIKYLSLFSGIGAFEKALERMNVPYSLVGYSDIDKNASKAYSLIHNVSTDLNLGDIKRIVVENLPNVDLITYGFPCQDISVLGYQKGIIKNETRSGLFFNACEIIKHTQPKVAIAENVLNLTSKTFAPQFSLVLAELENCGYNNYYEVLNPINYGAPQNRRRVFIVSIRKDLDIKEFIFPQGCALNCIMQDLLEKEVDSKYMLTDTGFKHCICLDEEKFNQGIVKKVNGAYINRPIAYALTRCGVHNQHAGFCNVINIHNDEPMRVIDYKRTLGDKRVNTDLRYLTERVL